MAVCAYWALCALWITWMGGVYSVILAWDVPLSDVSVQGVTGLKEFGEPAIGLWSRQ